MSTEKIMEQAQVFASAWSVVGGPFDSGDAMEVATQEKDELKRMVGNLVEERDALAADVACGAALLLKTDYVRIQELEEERDALAAKLAAAQGMADTMEMLRSEMIEAGVIDASVPPMFFPESIIPRLLKLAELEGQEPVAWVEVVNTYEGPYNFEGMALLGKGTHHLFARAVPAEQPVNARLLEALKALEVLFCPLASDSTAATWIEKARDAIAAAESKEMPK